MNGNQVDTVSEIVETKNENAANLDHALQIAGLDTCFNVESFIYIYCFFNSILY